jgi:hypothetical protein
MLKHFHRDHTVIGGIGGEFINIRGDYFEVFVSTIPGLSENIFALGIGIGNRSDLRIGEVFGHPQGKRSPSAPKFEDIQSVLQFCMLAGECEGTVLGVVEGFGIGVLVAGAVFQVFPKGVPVKFRGYFIVLLIGFFGKHRHGRGVGINNVFFRKFSIGFTIIMFALLESFSAKITYARPD